MSNITRLGRGATKKIHDAIDELFTNAKARLLGPAALRGKRIFIAFERTLSLPGVFEAGAAEEAVRFAARARRGQ